MTASTVKFATLLSVTNAAIRSGVSGRARKWMLKIHVCQCKPENREPPETFQAVAAEKTTACPYAKEVPSLRKQPEFLRQ